MLGRPGILRRTVLAASLAASVFPCGAFAGPWSLGAGGGWNTAYLPYPDPNSDPFFGGHHGPYASTWLVDASIARALSPSLQLRAEVSAFAHEGETNSFYGVYRAHRNPGIFSIASAAYSYAYLQSRAEILPLAIGVRVHRPFGRSGIGPYLEVLPTLFIVHWDEQATGSLDFYPDSTFSFSSHQDWTRAVAGATLGFGFQIKGGERWNLDYGIQWRKSAQIAPDSSPTPELQRGPLLGIDTLSLAMSIAWSP
jgi:hypothetical protein